MRISYSYGIVDLIHFGHIHALTLAKENSDYHVFGLVEDEASTAWMGSLVSNYAERKTVLENIRLVDEVVRQTTMDPLPNLVSLHNRYPDAELTLFHGNNIQIMPAENFLKKIGGKVVLTDYYGKLSPDNIIKALTLRNIPAKRISNLISTKANTLLALKERLTESRIEEIQIITAGEYRREAGAVLGRLQREFQGRPVVVRSSSSNEDSYTTSNAGHYESVLNVDSGDQTALSDAILCVLDSYGKDALLGEEEQVLIQPQTQEVRVSGVVFTRETQQNRPYYVVNYDDTGSTDSVTSGSGGKTRWIARDVDEAGLEGGWRKLLRSVREIERLMDGMVLDIEFAVTTQDEVVIFQVRPLAANYRFQQEESDLLSLIDSEQARYRGFTNVLDHGGMMLSDMAFWNPSEMIGSNPRNLDYSLYREIITKKAWNTGLVPLGYRAVNQELMVKLGNKPYISLDYSFLCLTPGVLPDALALKLMDYYKGKLRRDLTAHDKIEFEIVLSCFDFETPDRLTEMFHEGFTVEELAALREALKTLTVDTVERYQELLEQDRSELEELTRLTEELEKKLPYQERNLPFLLNRFSSLVQQIERLGTPQFSRQARCAFMSRSFCKTLVSRGYLPQGAMDAFLETVQTVTSSFEQDFRAYQEGRMDRQEFNRRYGHLRSGTYDIRSPRYDQIDFKGAQAYHKTAGCEKEPAELDRAALKKALADIGLAVDLDRFLDFLVESPKQRERFKFEFTKALSLALELLAAAGAVLGLNRKDLSYLEMADVLAAEYYQTPDELRTFWGTIIRQRREDYKSKSRLILPEVVDGESGLEVIEMAESRPNFITNKLAEGAVTLMDEHQDGPVEGRIVVISKADPGYDWIFAQGPKGLVTQYGGAASHMAIRCAEFGLPAAIGCGQKIFDFVKNCAAIRLDCAHGKISER